MPEEKKKKLPFGSKFQTGSLLKTMPDFKDNPDDLKHRLTMAGSVGAASGAIYHGGAMLVKKIKPSWGIKPSLAVTIPAILTGMATGYFSPDLERMVKKVREGKETKEELHKYVAMPFKVHKKSYEASQINPFEKKAFIRGIAKGIAGAGRMYLKGLMPAPKGSSFLRRAAGWGVKGATGFGAYAGVKSLYNRPSSGENYTTYLRNQMLRGNIKPEELSQQDMANVGRLGLR